MMKAVIHNNYLFQIENAEGITYNLQNAILNVIVNKDTFNKDSIYVNCQINTKIESFTYDVPIKFLDFIDD